MSTTTFDTAVTQARDLLRWHSPLRTELWAARLTADLEPDQVRPFLGRLTQDGSPEARLTLAALAAVNQPAEAAITTPAEPDSQPAIATPTEPGGRPADTTPAEPGGRPADTTPAEPGGRPAGGTTADGRLAEAGGTAPVGGGEVDAGVRPYTVAGSGMAATLAGWVRRMGRVRCEGAWYGKADPYGEQTLAVLSFRYENGKEPHILVVGIDQPNGGLAVDALVEEVKFLDDLGLRAADPGVVGGRILDAFELGDQIMGAMVADTLPAVRALAIARAYAVPGLVRGAADDTAARFDDLPDLPGAREAFEKLTEFVGDRPLWWSPGRVSQFFTSWLPREAILTDEAIAAMPAVVRAWSRFSGDHPAVRRQIDEDAPRLPALMADDSLPSLAKRIAQNRL
ncbi:hypothetical protein ITP53_09330 [Nonomuraea sp. K274]|uniref:Uncharacterized protein n=1 Tax=Nonomuraea cypriaca TaxID=1187855 RepID=A0A931A8H3_9ACTN|nr:hypothetical protein [Nonomuraea cypriaca]MBF8185943.1 hypothetical protein [Nonomuraea cypriaca]